jgi:hypothetical protein
MATAATDNDVNYLLFKLPARNGGVSAAFVVSKQLFHSAAVECTFAGF